jgi:hypothetical protein
MKRGIKVLRDDGLEGGPILKRLQPSTTLLNPFWELEEALSFRTSSDGPSSKQATTHTAD